MYGVVKTMKWGRVASSQRQLFVTGAAVATHSKFAGQAQGQPQTVLDPDGVLQMIHFKRDASAGDGQKAGPLLGSSSIVPENPSARKAPCRGGLHRVFADGKETLIVY